MTDFVQLAQETFANWSHDLRSLRIDSENIGVSFGEETPRDVFSTLDRDGGASTYTTASAESGFSDVARYPNSSNQVIVETQLNLADVKFAPNNPRIYLPLEQVKHLRIVVDNTKLRIIGKTAGLDRDYWYIVKRFDVERHAWECEWVD